MKIMAFIRLDIYLVIVTVRSHSILCHTVLLNQSHLVREGIQIATEDGADYASLQ